ncbi:MAG: hypothetical protein ABLT11_08955 [Candidatus Acidiferrum sp.]
MATTRQVGASSIGATTRPVSRAGFLNNYFYFFMSLLVAGVLVYGFSHTINKNLFHPAVAPPSILYLHAVVFTGWLIFFIFQSALVRTHNVRLHRQTGWFGLALGVAVLLVGVSTAIAMARFHIHQGATDAEGFLIVPLFDMIAFSIPFALAIYWRKKPEFHRRLILIASCALTAAGFGRFPAFLLPPPFFYAGVDVLILLGVARDLIVNRRIHPVYLYGLPAFAFGQIIVTYTLVHNSAWWLKIAHAIVG